jgi:hypothetical protein
MGHTRARKVKNGTGWSTGHAREKKRGNALPNVSTHDLSSELLTLNHGAGVSEEGAQRPSDGTQPAQQAARVPRGGVRRGCSSIPHANRPCGEGNLDRNHEPALFGMDAGVSQPTLVQGLAGPDHRPGAHYRDRQGQGVQMKCTLGLRQ